MQEFTCCPHIVHTFHPLSPHCPHISPAVPSLPPCKNSPVVPRISTGRARSTSPTRTSDTTRIGVQRLPRQRWRGAGESGSTVTTATRRAEAGPARLHQQRGASGRRRIGTRRRAGGAVAVVGGAAGAPPLHWSAQSHVAQEMTTGRWVWGWI